MKLKTFFAAAAVVAALASCGPKAKPVSEQLVGQWTGLDSVKITVVDSTGNQVEQSFVAPVELDYLADSTFTAIIKVTDSTVITIGGVAAVNRRSCYFLQVQWLVLLKQWILPEILWFFLNQSPLISLQLM